VEGRGAQLRARTGDQAGDQGAKKTETRRWPVDGPTLFYVSNLAVKRQVFTGAWYCMQTFSCRGGKLF
jgi:hypothetical protein